MANVENASHAHRLERSSRRVRPSSSPAASDQHSSFPEPQKRSVLASRAFWVAAMACLAFWSALAYVFLS